jgi:3-oxoacyl-[acyl-carrier-protein] synthase II
MTRRVVITGLGAVTPIGSDVATTWESACAGICGVGPITLFDASTMKTRIAGELKDFDPTRRMDRKDARRMGRVIQVAVNAAGEAIEDAGIITDHVDPDQIGVVFGTGIGGIASLLEYQHTLETKGPARIGPFFVPSVLPDMCAGVIAIQWGFRGPSMAVITACATGNNTLGEAAELIKRGDVDVVVAGGAEAAILPLTIAGFDQMGAIACDFNDRPTAASRPFDAGRCGFVMAEGAAALVLEELDHATARGARIYAEIVGYGATTDAYHVAAPDPSGAGAVRAMKLAIERAGLQPADVQYINAHGTSTPLNDPIESAAIRTVFGPAADSVMVSSTKSVTGHMLGAAGAMEAIFTTLAIYHGVVPPTINYETPDPTCDLDYVPNKARHVQITTGMSNSFGFGGHNASIVLTRHNGRS